MRLRRGIVLYYIVKLHYATFIIWIPTCAFYTPLFCGFYFADSLIWILLYKFQRANSIVWIPLWDLDVRLYYIDCIVDILLCAFHSSSLCGFYCANSILRTPSCGFHCGIASWNCIIWIALCGLHCVHFILLHCAHFIVCIPFNSIMPFYPRQFIVRLHCANYIMRIALYAFYPTLLCAFHHTCSIQLYYAHFIVGISL